MNDNRNYFWSINSISKREEYNIITTWVKEKSKVIDLGCGDGSLLKLLKDKKKVNGTGVELSVSGCEAARKKGIKAICRRIDMPLEYKSLEFDYAICNVTLQMVMYPEVLVKEMKRIAKIQILSFPNFAFIVNRLDMLLNGRMPRVMIPGYKWYSTGHIHQLSINDFIDFCKEINLVIIDQKHVYPLRFGKLPIPKKIISLKPNLFAYTAIFQTTSK